jgi:hypothetical protein
MSSSTVYRLTFPELLLVWFKQGRLTVQDVSEAGGGDIKRGYVF